MSVSSWPGQSVTWVDVIFNAQHSKFTVPVFSIYKASSPKLRCFRKLHRPSEYFSSSESTISLHTVSTLSRSAGQRRASTSSDCDTNSDTQLLWLKCCIDLSVLIQQSECFFFQVGGKFIKRKKYFIRCMCNVSLAVWFRYDFFRGPVTWSTSTCLNTCHNYVCTLFRCTQLQAFLLTCVNRGK